ncbi:hypothetical protein [Methylobacterium sp. yr596]|uniref:hypothetical protein n=1 Tax=Methylobacterium sp. yr596 TaxID=1761800 RepID=UPI0008F1BAB8|nr:hypothetical protein [Methylobacterium sp. yr596]SFF76953.1 hypothetical protein SAMN04487844_14723 [Methylobacterium sp. yr596]
MLRTILALTALLAASPAWAQQQGAGVATTLYDIRGNPVGTASNPLQVGGSGGGGVPTTPSGVTRTRLTCTLPAYASGGNIVCTNEAGAQTTTACAANTACLVSAANANRKTVLATVRTASVTCDVGYSASVAPGNAIGIDGPAGGAVTQGGSLNETPAHVGAYYAACPAAATLVFVQGQ